MAISTGAEMSHSTYCTQVGMTTSHSSRRCLLCLRRAQGSGEVSSRELELTVRGLVTLPATSGILTVKYADWPKRYVSYFTLIALQALADLMRIWPISTQEGRCTARLSLRVDTLISIRFMAQRPSQPSACAALQVGSTTSWPS